MSDGDTPDIRPYFRHRRPPEVSLCTSSCFRKNRPSEAAQVLILFPQSFTLPSRADPYRASNFRLNFKRSYDTGVEMMRDSGERSVLRLLSRFVLEVLPYAMSALIAGILLPSLLSAHFHASQPTRAIDTADDKVGTVEVVRGAHEVFSGQMDSGLSTSVLTHQFFDK
jgi:hypothetical protein